MKWVEENGYVVGPLEEGRNIIQGSGRISDRKLGENGRPS